MIADLFDVQIERLLVILYGFWEAVIVVGLGLGTNVSTTDREVRQIYKYKCDQCLTVYGFPPTLLCLPCEAHISYI